MRRINSACCNFPTNFQTQPSSPDEPLSGAENHSGHREDIKNDLSFRAVGCVDNTRWGVAEAGVGRGTQGKKKRVRERGVTATKEDGVETVEMKVIEYDEKTGMPSAVHAQGKRSLGIRSICTTSSGGSQMHSCLPCFPPKALSIDRPF